jgi:hypothetical protein
MDAVRARLGVKTVPEQLYTDNFLRLTHTGSGTSVAFSAADALQGTTHTPWFFSFFSDEHLAVEVCSAAAGLGGQAEMCSGYEHAVWFSHRLQFPLTSAGWVEEHLPPVQVSSAHGWTQAKQSEIDAHAAQKFTYDWWVRLQGGCCMVGLHGVVATKAN